MGSCQLGLPASSNPINTRGPEGRATYRLEHTMGHLGLVVLGLTCCWAVVSAAKVSEGPAEGPLSPLTKRDLEMGQGTADGRQAGSPAGRASLRKRPQQ